MIMAPALLAVRFAPTLQQKMVCVGVDGVNLYLQVTAVTRLWSSEMKWDGAGFQHTVIPEKMGDDNFDGPLSG